MIWHRRAALNTPWNLMQLRPSLLIDGDHVELQDATHINKAVDLSGLGHHPLMGTLANMPLPVANDADFRGHGTISITGIQNLVATFSQASPYVILAAFKANTTTGANRYLCGDTFNDLSSVAFIDALNRLAFYDQAKFANLPGSARQDGITIVSVRCMYNSGIASLRHNYSLTAITTQAATAAGRTMTGLRIGNNSAGNSPLVGKLGELALIPGDISDATEVRAIRYLADKYGATVTA